MGQRNHNRDAAFKTMFDVCYQPVAAYVLRREWDKAAAEDVIGEVFLAAWRRWEDLASFDEPLPWLYRTAANSLQNSRRSRQRHLRLVDKLTAEHGDIQPATADQERAPLLLEQSDIAIAFRQLNPNDQEILRLVAWEGLQHAEAAIVLDCTPNAATLRLKRARARLESLLDQAAGEGEGGSKPDEPDPIKSEPNDTSSEHMSIDYKSIDYKSIDYKSIDYKARTS